MQAKRPRPTCHTCRSLILAGTSPCSTASRISATTGASISASSNTRPVWRISPHAQADTSTAPTMPITGSSHAALKYNPPNKAMIANTEVAASATTCR